MYGNYRGGHQDNWVDEQMNMKNIETSGGYQAKVSGDQGELALSSVLRSLPDYYHVIDNVLLQTKKGSTQIDHIIVSPFGVFVVETKNHKGLIFGDCYSRVWTQVLNGRAKFRMYSPVLQNMGHIQHLSAQIRLSMDCIQGVIVFTNNDANLSNVNCPFCFNVDQLYYYIMQFKTQIFNEKQLVKLIKRIDTVNTDSYMNRMKHIEFVNSQKYRRGILI